MRNLLVAVLAGTGAAAVVVPQVAWAASPAAVIKTHDADKDGTLDWAEVQTAAAARMAKADPDKDGTLTKTEAMAAGVTPAEFAKADPDKDGTLSKEEYMSFVESLFKMADADHDGTLSAAELKTGAGRKLMAIIE